MAPVRLLEKVPTDLYRNACTRLDASELLQVFSWQSLRASVSHVRPTLSVVCGFFRKPRLD